MVPARYQPATIEPLAYAGLFCPTPMSSPSVPFSPVRFGIVSPGRWGRKLLDAVKDSPLLELIGASSRDHETAADIAKTYGGTAYTDISTLLADPQIEAVLLPTPHFLHHEQATAALKAGKHVFVEKPIATTLELAEDMAQLAEKTKLILAVGHQARFTGAARLIKAMLEAGEFGQLASVVITQGYPLLLDPTSTSWRQTEANVPGGPLDEFGVHYFEALQYWFGPARRVTGFVNRQVTANDVPDVASAILEYDGGVIASYNAHFVSVGLSRMTLFGTKGALDVNRFGEGPSTWQPITDMAAARAGGSPPETVTFDGPKLVSTALTAELESFARAIRSGSKPEVGARESLATLRISRAVLEASRTGRTITL
jgi:predicted dehydrogenase